jgi:hypothetical protein
MEYEGTNRYEIGNSDLKQSKTQQTDLKNTKWIMLSFLSTDFTITSTITFTLPTGDNRRKCGSIIFKIMQSYGGEIDCIFTRIHWIGCILKRVLKP